MKLSKAARNRYEGLTDGQLMTTADGLCNQMDRYWRAGDLKEAQGVARELERLEVILHERDLYERWMQPKRRKAALSLNDLLGGGKRSDNKP